VQEWMYEGGRMDGIAIGYEASSIYSRVCLFN